MTYRLLHIDDAERIPGHGFTWRPVRKALASTAFGLNAYTADAGDEVIDDHDETSAGSAGHEELCAPPCATTPRSAERRAAPRASARRGGAARRYG